MEDYSQKIKELILCYFLPIPQDNSQQVVYKSNEELMAMLMGVIPANQLTDHHLFEVLSVAGFCIELATATADLAQKQYLWKMYQHE
jgi:Na+/H+-dicarboxylate symporter